MTLQRQQFCLIGAHILFNFDNLTEIYNIDYDN